MASAQKQHKPGVWTDEEDVLLAKWQGQLGNRWSEVAKHIPGKTGQQCAQRWRHRVNPNISREKWSAEEDARLATLVDKHGSSWAEISRCLPGRTDQQCMGRWRRHLDPSIRREGWVVEEDEQLRELYAEYGSSWSCISKSMNGRTAQQCRARWCQLTNAERPSRSGASRSKSNSSATGPAFGTEQEAVNPRRQSTANTTCGGSALSAASADPLALFAAAAAEGAALAAAAAAAATVAASGAATMASQRRGVAARVQPGLSRRLSTVSEAVSMRGESSWSQEEEEEEEESDESPGFTLRRTTSRTARPASHSCPPSAPAKATAAVMATAGLPKQQHNQLQPPATVAIEQQVPTPAPFSTMPAAAPTVVLPPVLLPLELERPAGDCRANKEEEEDSPALTRNAAPNAAAAAAEAIATSTDLPAPLRAQLPRAPPLFTPSNSSGRKRSASSRLAAFGPALPPLVIPDSATLAAKGTPMRPTPGSGPMSLGLRSPNILTMLQSPQALEEDLFRSPGFGGMVTPPWAKSGSSSGGSAASEKAAAAAAAAAVAAAIATAAAAAPCEAEGMCEDDRRLSMARRLDSAPSFGNGLAAAHAASTAQQQQMQQQHTVAAVPVAAALRSGGPSAAAFDFGALLGSPPKKSKISSPGASNLTAATAAGTPWVPASAAAIAAGLLLQQHSESGGGTSLAVAVQQHLLLASTAKAGTVMPGSGAAPAVGATPSNKENGEQAARQLTLTAVKAGPVSGAGPVQGSPAKQLTSSNVRMRLHALLDTA